MRWIRSPWWDSIWVLSGLPIGIALIVMPPKARLVAFAVMVCLDTGHTIAPIAAAWMNRGFRQLMRTELVRFILLPALMLAASGLIGFATQAGWTGYDLRSPHQMFRITDFTNPFPVFCWLYWTWNIYHFGMQNFGVVRLYRRGRGSRNLCLVLWVGITAFCRLCCKAFGARRWKARARGAGPCRTSKGATLGVKSYSGRCAGIVATG